MKVTLERPVEVERPVEDKKQSSDTKKVTEHIDVFVYDKPPK